uniref:multicopper oxidase domain-containing protein n=1 Tax=Paludibacterium denitrificans TaxID=2675226 RepID=UPI002478191E|nr:multicopper oxidase domain-containing protein [Paludibacterium denitrificans]
MASGRTSRFSPWRDVVNVPAGESVRLRFVQSQPGLRMFHCHILEHEDAGMMGMLEVRA